MVDGDAGGFYGDFGAGAGEFVGGDAVDLFRGEDGRDLVDVAVEVLAEGAEFVEGLGERLWVGRGGAFGVEGVGGEAEADVAGVVLLGLAEELREARVFAEEQRENSGGHGVERAEVADGFFAGGAAHDGDYVVRGHAGGFVEYQKTVHAASSLVA